MKRIFAAAAGLLIVVALSGCASSMVSEATQHSDEGITSVIQATLEVNDKVKARHAERIARGTKGVKDVNNELTVGGIKR